MCSASEAVDALLTGLVIALTITVVVAFVGAALVQFCVVPLAPWCGL